MMTFNEISINHYFRIHTYMFLILILFVYVSSMILPYNLLQRFAKHRSHALQAYLSSSAPESRPEIKLSEMRRFMEDSLRAVGAPDSAAKAQADLLVFADLMGHHSHGLNRLEFYVNDCTSGACQPWNVPQIMMETVGTAWVDGRNALGATIGNFCMSLAINKAKTCGIGWVAAKGCNHFGIASYWTMMAEAQGLIGMAFSNSSPVMVPTRAKKRAMGTNPIGFAAPATNGDRLMVDMATTAVAKGKIELQVRKGEPIPLGWALGKDGQPTTNAKEALEAGLLMPLGGIESNSGFKGYALSAMVEVLTSGLSGSKTTHNIRVWALKEKQDPPNLGHCYAAINPCCFAPGFYERVADCLNTWRSLEPADPKRPVVAPGDLEHGNYKRSKLRGAIAYPKKQIEDYDKFAKKIGIKPLQISK